jgi:hypothetical protein
MELPLIKIKCHCTHEEACKTLGIPQDVLKSLIYLSGANESREFANTLAARKLKRKQLDADKFTLFLETIKKGCPYYKHEGF